METLPTDASRAGRVKGRSWPGASASGLRGKSPGRTRCAAARSKGLLPSRGAVRAGNTVVPCDLRVLVDDTAGQVASAGADGIEVNSGALQRLEWRGLPERAAEAGARCGGSRTLAAPAVHETRTDRVTLWRQRASRAGSGRTRDLLAAGGSAWRTCGGRDATTGTVHHPGPSGEL